MYVVLDIESSGGKLNEEAIIEIALFRFDGKEVVDQLISLVHTDRPIQSYVQSMTGITPNMLTRAPRFHEIAKRIVEITDGAVLVGHGVSFDYRMLKMEFERLGYPFEKSTIDTVNWSRKLFPDLDSYKLANLCDTLGIWLPRSHRAGDDARATVDLFKRLIDKDLDKRILSLGSKGDRNEKPANKLQSLLAQVKNGAGIYYLYDENGKLLKAGMAEKLNNELSRLFLSPEAQYVALQENVQSIKTEMSGSTTLARMRYHAERLNSEDQSVYFPLGKGTALVLNRLESRIDLVRNVHLQKEHLAFFSSSQDARKVLKYWKRNYSLCSTPSSLKKKEACSSWGPHFSCSEACAEYRALEEFKIHFQQKLNDIQFSQGVTSLRLVGRKAGERAYVQLSANKSGMLFYNLEEEIINSAQLEKNLTVLPNDAYMRGLFWRYHLRNPSVSVQ
jgi:DNA polymerase III subunit epsilon